MVYYCKNVDKLPPQMIEHWQKKYNISCRPTINGILSFVGKVLLKKILNENYGIGYDCKILKTDDGKPYIENIPQHFSISHSKTIVAVAVAEKEIGMDIQQIPLYSVQLAKRICSSNELNEIAAADDKAAALAKIWSRKECHIKYSGKMRWHKICEIPSGGCQTCIFEKDFAAAVYTQAEFELKMCNVDWGEI